MKKLIIVVLLLNVIHNVKSQSSISGGVDALMAEGNIKNWSFVPNLHYSLAMGEKWAFQAGLGYLFNSYKFTYSLDPKTSSIPEAEYTIKNKISGIHLFGDFKKYIKDGNFDEGGFYARFGIGYLILKGKSLVSDYDTSMYNSYEGYDPGLTTSPTYKVLNVRAFIGYEREIADMLQLYAEVGMNLFLNEGMYSSFSIGIRKQFLKL